MSRFAQAWRQPQDKTTLEAGGSGHSPEKNSNPIGLYRIVFLKGTTDLRGSWYKGRFWERVEGVPKGWGWCASGRGGSCCLVQRHTQSCALGPPTSNVILDTFGYALVG